MNDNQPLNQQQIEAAFEATRAEIEKQREAYTSDDDFAKRQASAMLTAIAHMRYELYKQLLSDDEEAE